MEEALRVSLAVDLPEGCPVAAASAATDERVTDVSWSGVEAEGEVVEEFTAPAGAAEKRDEIEPIFESGERTRYRFRRDPDETCFCDAVEQFGYPVADVTAESGSLVVTVHTDDIESVRDVLAATSDTFGDVSLRSLRRTDDRDTADAVLLDRGRLTTRQREVLTTAIDMGYFEYPKDANAGDVAAELDISVSTLAEHLAAAQTKLFDQVFG